MAGGRGCTLTGTPDAAAERRVCWLGWALAQNECTRGGKCGRDVRVSQALGGRRHTETSKQAAGTRTPGWVRSGVRCARVAHTSQSRRRGWWSASTERDRRKTASGNARRPRCPACRCIQSPQTRAKRRQAASGCMPVQRGAGKPEIQIEAGVHGCWGCNRGSRFCPACCCYSPTASPHRCCLLLVF